MRCSNAAGSPRALRRDTARHRPPVGARLDPHGELFPAVSALHETTREPREGSEFAPTVRARNVDQAIDSTSSHRVTPSRSLNCSGRRASSKRIIGRAPDTAEGADVDRRLHRRVSGAAGNIGHTPMLHGDGLTCRCGKTDCLESTAAAWPLLRDAHAALLSGETSGRRPKSAEPDTRPDPASHHPPVADFLGIPEACGLPNAASVALSRSERGSAIETPDPDEADAARHGYSRFVPTNDTHHIDLDKLTPAAAEAVGASAPGTGATSGGVFLPDTGVPSDVVHERESA
jgi:hypothetical protein